MSESLKPELKLGLSAALEGAAATIIPNPGYLEIAGETRKDYLQRQTTNDIALLSPSRALPSLLTSPTGRILEVFTLLDNGASIGMLTQPGHGPGLAAYFKKRVFFKDQVTIEDRSADWAQIELHGPKAAEILQALGFAKTPGLDDVVEADWHGHPLRVVGEEGFANSEKLRILAPAAAASQLTKQLTAAQVQTLNFETREILRVESGQAGEPEFGGDYTPFELGLSRRVSAEKGCYTGQEVLARQVTYDKIVRRLVQLQAAEPMEAGASVHVDGKSIGQISSTALSPRLGPIALAVLRRPYDQDGTRVEVSNHSGAVSATVRTEPIA